MTHRDTRQLTTMRFGFDHAQTAANAVESSWGAYCPGQTPGPPPEFGTCLGDLFSISFLENECADLHSAVPLLQ